MYRVRLNPFEIPSPQILLGRAFHECVKKFLQGDLQSQQWLYKLWKLHRSGVVTQDMSGDMGITYWWEWFKKTKEEGFKIKGVERKMSLKKFGTTINGRLDTVFYKKPRYRVVDWKTGSSDLRNTEDIGEFPKQSIQLYLYGEMVVDSFEVDPELVDVGFYYPMMDEFVSTPLIESDGRSKVEMCLDGVAEHNFMKLVTHNCEWCSFIDLCDPMGMG